MYGTHVVCRAHLRRCGSCNEVLRIVLPLVRGVYGWTVRHSPTPTTATPIVLLHNTLTRHHSHSSSDSASSTSSTTSSTAIRATSRHFYTTRTLHFITKVVVIVVTLSYTSSEMVNTFWKLMIIVFFYSEVCKEYWPLVCNYVNSTK